MYTRKNSTVMSMFLVGVDDSSHEGQSIPEGGGDNCFFSGFKWMSVLLQQCYCQSVDSIDMSVAMSTLNIDLTFFNVFYLPIDTVSI